MIIALSGLAGSGKDTVARMLVRARHFTKCVAFAGPMKRFVKEVFQFTDDQLYGPSANRNAPDPRYTRPNGQPLTPRFALQTLGTEWGRNCDADLWAKVGVRAAQELEAQGRLAVITDCRFVNEAKLVRGNGGRVWFIDRPFTGVTTPTHPSETEMLTPEFQSLVTTVIPNHGTMDLLYEIVREALRALP